MIVSRQPRNPIPWLLLFFACVASTQLVVSYLAQSMVADGTSAPGWVAWLSSSMISPRSRRALHPAPAAFPTGRPATPRFRPLLRATLAVLIIAVIVQPLTGDELDPYVNVQNPVGLLPPWANGILVVCEAIILSLSIASVVVRYRRASVSRSALRSAGTCWRRF